MEWNDEQRALRAAVVALGPVLSDGHIERDGTGTFSRDGWKRLADTGLFALPFASEHGGLGQSLLTTMYVLEGLGESCRDAGLNFSASTQIVSAGVPLARFGSAALKERYLPKIAAGTAIGAHAITEPGGGSDVMGMRTSAVPDPAPGADGFVLNGSKAFISNGPIADLIVVYARTGPPGNPAAITAFLLDRDTPGLTIGNPIGKMGLRTSPLCEVFLDDVRVGADRIIGRAGSGFLILDHVMKWEILCSFVINAGEMRHRLAQCVEYARGRTQFGQHIGAYQSVSNKLVEMRIDVETACKWLYDTAEKLLAKQNVSVDIAISKLVTSEANVRSALHAVQIFGGYGYMTETGLEKEVRNAVAGTIYSGTTEIQQQRIATLMGLNRGK